MAGALAQSPVLQLGKSLDNSELSRKTWRPNRVSTSVSPSSGHGLQILTGLRRAGAVDALTVRSVREFQSTLSPAVISRASSSSGVSVVAEFGEEETTELTISPAPEENGVHSNGVGNASNSIFEGAKGFRPAPRNSSADEPGRSRSSNGGVSVDSYRPPGAGRSSNGGARVDSYRPPGAGRSSGTATTSSQPTPATIVSKKGGKRVVIDRWTAPGSRQDQVQEILQRLENVEPTEEGIKAAMEGWDASIGPRDITSVIGNLKWKTAREFFNWLQSRGYVLNVVVYNVLLGRFRAGRVWNVAEEFAEHMIESGMTLDNYTYSTLISCALQCNFPQDSLKWFDKMHEAGCVPDEVTYSNMALVYSRLGRFKDAVDLYERLRDTGWKPDKISYGTMVNVYSRAGNYFKATAVIREMQQQGLMPEAVVYNILIKYFAREGKTGKAKRVFRDMEAAGVKPTEYTLSLMIDVHGRAGETKEAFELFTRMKEEKLPLDVVVYNSLLKMCAEEGLVPEAETLLAGLVGRGMKPDVVTFKSMINLYAKEGKVKQAEKMANRMVEFGFQLDVIVYSCLIKACGISKEFQKAAGFLEKMLAEECEMDDKCCGVLLSLMNACETTEDRAVMIDCLRKAKPALSEIIDVLLAEDLQVDVLEEKVKTLLAESMEDSHRPFCNALVDLCWTMGKKDHAQQVLSISDTQNVYPGGLRSKTKHLWVLHLRSLSFNAAECGLYAWIQDLREELAQGVEFPKTLVVETGAGRNRGEVARLFNVILSKLQEMGAPFEPCAERTDWITSAGSAGKEWLSASPDFQSPAAPVAEQPAE